MKVSSEKMASLAVFLTSGLLLAVVAVNANRPDQSHFKSSGIYPRSIKTSPRDRGGGFPGLGNPAEWTMSKANLVAEFYSNEPAQSVNNNRDRSQKSIFSFLTGNLNNRSNEKSTYVPAVQPSPQIQMQPPPQPGYGKQDKNGNLVASETNYNLQSVPFDITRNNINVHPGGYSTPFRPIIFPQQQQNIILAQGSPVSGYPQNVRPPRGPPPPPPRQYIYDARPINGLRPPLAPSPQQQHQQPQLPPPQYLPPQLSQQPRPHPQQPQGPPSIPAYQIPKPQSPLPNSLLPQPQYPVPSQINNTASFTPSAQYQPQEQAPNPSPSGLPNFQPGSPSPQILDTYSKQAVYPVPPPGQYSTEKPLIYVMANSSFDQQVNNNHPKFQGPFNANTLNSYTQYENEPIPPPSVPSTASLKYQFSSSSSAEGNQQSQSSSSTSAQGNQYQSTSTQGNQYPPPSYTSSQGKQQYQPPSQGNQYQSSSSTSSQGNQQYQSPSSSSTQPNQPPQQPDLNALALTEPLSQVLAEANTKAGEAMDKTIRFVIHKPEDEDIVKNAILEDAQNRYEDVKFVQGPTLKLQRKETVYLPPKKKTVVYILLKEPQIDTDVEVMSPQEDEPAPEVYITYQKSDGAVKTKHYSPKPMKQEDMKKYLDIEEGDHSYGSGEESRIQPRFSKSTSVSLSTSSKVSRKTATTSMSTNKNNLSRSDIINELLLANHNLSPSSANETASLADLKGSPLLYTSRNVNVNQIQISNGTSSVRLPQKKPRSSDFARELPLPSPRRLRHYPIQCPTVK